MYRCRLLYTGIFRGLYGLLLIRGLYWWSTARGAGLGVVLGSTFRILSRAFWAHFHSRDRSVARAGTRYEVLGRPSGGSCGTFEVSIRASAAGELLIALGLRFGTIVTCYWGPASGFGYLAVCVQWFLVLVSTMYRVVSMKQISGDVSVS